MSANLVLQPLVPVWLLALVFVPALMLLGVAAMRRTRGWALRALSLAALGGALLDPHVIQQETQPRRDVALIVVDDSPSQKIGNRPAQLEEALPRLQAELSRHDTLEVRTIRVGGDSQGETRLFQEMQRAVLDDAAERLAAVLVISDGQVHDVPQPGAVPWLRAPLHLLLTGDRDERDRRVVVEHAPAYGLVDQTVDVTYRIDEAGPEQAGSGDRRARVQFRIDGVEAGSAEVPVGADRTFALPIRHAGPTVLEIRTDATAGEVSEVNNWGAVAVTGVRDRLRVLLISGQPHPGERTWRNLLKSDPAVDLVHFTILRPPEKDDSAPLRELSLIVFPVQELFENRLDDFDLVVFDRYVVRGILPVPYYTRIADYVRRGGALLVEVGPEFAGAQSLFRTPLGDIVPVAPTGRVIEQAFRPDVTDVGRRHPVTSGLAGETVAGDAELEEAQAGPAWGRWFRIVDSEVRSGVPLLTGAGGRPLLVVDRVDQGRAAALLSDQIWLWARGFDGGGPHAELLRRLAHWLMKEPALEEEHLDARIADGRLMVSRRSLGGGDVAVTITDPAGNEQTLRLDPGGADGIARGEVAAPTTGLWRVSDGTHTALAAAGRLSPREFADLRATPDRLAPLVEATGGGVAWLSDGLPAFRSVAAGRDGAGRGWLGLQRNRAHAVTGFSEVSLLPALLVLAAALGGLAGAWWREGR